MKSCEIASVLYPREEEGGRRRGGRGERRGERERERAIPGRAPFPLKNC